MARAAGLQQSLSAHLSATYPRLSAVWGKSWWAEGGAGQPRGYNACRGRSAAAAAGNSALTAMGGKKVCIVGSGNWCVGAANEGRGGEKREREQRVQKRKAGEGLGFWLGAVVNLARESGEEFCGALRVAAFLLGVIGFRGLAFMQAGEADAGDVRLECATKGGQARFADPSGFREVAPLGLSLSRRLDLACGKGSG